MKREHTA